VRCGRRLVGSKVGWTSNIPADMCESLEKLAEPQSTVARIHESPKQLAEKGRLLMERTMELNAAQGFLTKVDATEVVSIVEPEHPHQSHFWRSGFLGPPRSCT